MISRSKLFWIWFSVIGYFLGFPDSCYGESVSKKVSLVLPEQQRQETDESKLPLLRKLDEDDESDAAAPKANKNATVSEQAPMTPDQGDDEVGGDGGEGENDDGDKKDEKKDVEDNTGDDENPKDADDDTKDSNKGDQANEDSEKGGDNSSDGEGDGGSDGKGDAESGGKGDAESDGKGDAESDGKGGADSDGKVDADGEGDAEPEGVVEVHEDAGTPAETKGPSEIPSEKENDTDTGSDKATEPPPKAQTESDSEEFTGGGKYGLGVLVLVVGIALYFKVCRKSGGGMPPIAGHRSPHTKYQEVASNDDDMKDDWGWEDENDLGGDVEMNASATSKEMQIPRPAGFALKQRSPSMEKKQIVIANSANGRQISSPQHKQQLNAFAQPPQSATSSFQAQSQYQHPQTITSLGVPSLGAVKKIAPRKPKQEDDIFASMGLAAQPKFETNRPAVRSTPPSSGGTSSAWRAVQAAPAVALSSLSVPMPSASSSDAWDDGDLDDLLDD